MKQREQIPPHERKIGTKNVPFKVLWEMQNKATLLLLGLASDTSKQTWVHANVLQVLQADTGLEWKKVEIEQ